MLCVNMCVNISSETFRARYYEVGPDGCITIQALSNYFQEAASNHATELGAGMGELMDKGQSWMLSRFFIQISRFPGWKNPVTIDTWPAGNERMYAMRLFRLRCGEAEIGFGSSAWLLIDLERRRPLRPDFVRGFDVRGPEIGLEKKLPDKIDPPAECPWQRTFTVRASDLDMNRHVNNVNYIDWALEALPPDTRGSSRLRRLQIDYLAECHEGDTVISKCAPAGDGGCYRHGIYRADGSFAAAAASCWQTMENGG
jgi:medium-chain acyl-[acyl-carrier-protein] hydrolase